MKTVQDRDASRQWQTLRSFSDVSESRLAVLIKVSVYKPCMQPASGQFLVDRDVFSRGHFTLASVRREKILVGGLIILIYDLG